MSKQSPIRHMTDKYFLAVNCTATDNETHNNQKHTKYKDTNSQHKQTALVKKKLQQTRKS